MRNSVRVCKFNPDRDALEVVGGLSVNITDMMETGIVKDTSQTLDNNGIDDPNQIIGLVRDEFAAIDAMRAVRKYGKKAPAKAQSQQQQQPQPSQELSYHTYAQHA